VIIGLVMGRARFLDILAGAVAWPVAAILAVFVVGGFWLVLRDIMGSLGLAPIKFDLAILTCGSLVAAIVTIGVERLAVKGRSIESLSLGTLGWMVGLAVASSWYLPGASYLFTWPTAFSLLGLMSLMLMRRGSAAGREAVLVGCLPALLLFPPLAREAFEGLSLRLVGPLMIVVVVFLGMILPLLAPLIVPPKLAE
jgi:hypothetical protein